MTERPLTPERAKRGAPEAGSTRQQILAAAAQVLRDHGHVGMTTRAIARQAGVADGTLYIHFPTKEELILATVEAELPGFGLELPTELTASRSLEAAFEDIVRAAVQYGTTLVPLAGALFSDPDLLARLQVTLAELHIGPQLVYLRVADYIAAEQRRGRIKARLDPLGAATLLLGACFQHAYLRHLIGADPLGLSENEFVTNQVQTLMVCLGRRSAREHPRKKDR